MLVHSKDGIGQVVSDWGRGVANVTAFMQFVIAAIVRGDSVASIIVASQLATAGCKVHTVPSFAFC